MYCLSLYTCTSEPLGEKKNYGGSNPGMDQHSIHRVGESSSNIPTRFDAMETQHLW